MTALTHHARRPDRATGNMTVLAALTALLALTAVVAPLAASAGTSTPAAKSCGTVPAVAAADPDGIVSRLSLTARQGYNGYGGTVRTSPWANWTPKHGAPYTVGISWAALTTPFQVQTAKLLRQALERNSQIGKVVFLSLPSNTAVPEQLQQYQSLVRQHVDLIISQPLAVEAVAPLADQAGKAGIPTVTMMSTNPSLYSVNINPSHFLDGAQTAAYLAGTILHGRGNVVINHSIPGVRLDAETVAGFRAALARCPDVKVVGETTGYFSPPATKGAMLQFLATHPEKIDGVLDVATMAPAVIGAFQQAGRPVPTVTDIGAQNASLAYWNRNRAEYTGIGVGTGTASFASAAYRVAMRMLQGQGIKATDLVGPEPIITKDNLSAWVEPDWTPETPGTAEGKCCYAWTESFLRPFFTRFGPVSG